ncbi:cyclophilin-like peptidyl-prolyl cis-trans isomerase family protein [Artemisia annua]|uniref:Cyclophilin-like peptidyl-prolyl cis-trans isomerase family protein n=1 Tax=Artemisia annua TaxID=35608 RepID=A0A2U1NJ52_ARTAN|nr:cyclophilin-like peptidyl-prolyl cis-trans isomerase family protein [Artemisia annua]
MSGPEGGPPAVTLETSMGSFTVELYDKHAPRTCKNLFELSRRGLQNLNENFTNTKEWRREKPEKRTSRSSRALIVRLKEVNLMEMEMNDQENVHVENKLEISITHKKNDISSIKSWFGSEWLPLSTDHLIPCLGFSL